MRGPLGEQPEAIIEPVRQALGAQETGAAGRELQSQGNAVEPVAYAGDGGGVGLGEGEAGDRLPGALAEEGHGVRGRHVVDADCARGRHGQRTEPDHRLTRKAEHLPARGQDHDVGAAGQDGVRQPGGGGHEVLAVVEDHEEAPVPQLVGEGLVHRPP